MKFKFPFLLLILSLILSCSQEDEYDFYTDFYSNAETSATANNLIGIWSIYFLEFEGQKIEVPLDYLDCGRNYSVFKENGIYEEVLFEDSNCSKLSNTLNWNLSKGIITLSNNFNETEEIVVTKLTNSEFNFKTKLDVDGDGEQDIITAFLKPYVPKEIDNISDTFSRNTSATSNNYISYNWDPYTGSEPFIAYEIYRSASSGDYCSKNNAVLVETITDPNTTVFRDISPPNEEHLCYFLKVKIQSGLLGESGLETLNTYNLVATPVNLENPTVINNTISLKWTKSEMPYFSHYEISYSNYAPNISAFGEQNVIVTKITDKNKTSFIDENPPYLEKPYYSIHVYDIFGNKTYDTNDNFITSWEVDFKREEILDLTHIISYEINPNKPNIYLYGYDSNTVNLSRIYNYNYETNSVEAVSTKDINYSNYIPIKFYTTVYGDEIFVDQSGAFDIYDANSLDFKYSLEPKELFSIDDFIYTSSGYYVFVEDNYIYTYSRNNDILTLVDKKMHFPNYQSGYDYKVLETKDNQLLIGHYNEPNSILFSIDNYGLLIKLKLVPVPLKQNKERNSSYNLADNYIINFKEQKLYSGNDFSSITTFNQPNFASTVSLNGKVIYGTNNDPSWSFESDSEHKKIATIYNRDSQSYYTIATKGYPQIIFENYKNEIVSISSGMKKADFYHNINDKRDLFVEIIK
ncbi:hypothetical protein BW723_12285 [Polaribacter reichenbachii]|uniref:Lipocalin-like domain-containing protein n=1 Tax=Polaribacter reichenbachii TaxID=996801 RepID=A0A1B8TPC4_9FLAO|nr:hypothetical protein [Polaribacter reichenbachii]APZ47012.1 hypothetical protein BW723_12285 [Polaribacter reichenbachii]AUC17654.1 hypothetical protein BTO17_02735 [Polaribacter reichenbachii]OBY61472.1 hypothetical protein LPB301_15490 [Polaribacter reichenbachii]